MKIENINCIRCKYYLVTWDNSFPRGCKLFGFKGKAMPSVMVNQATGAPCKNFEENKRTGSNTGGV